MARGKKGPRITQETQIVQVDEEGVVKNELQSRTINYGAEPDYIKLYLQDILYLSDMPTQYSSALMSLLRRVSYAGDEYGMCIILAPVIRDAICKELGLQKRQSLANILQKLVKGEILYLVDRNVYRLNPYLFGRGTWADISKIRMEVNYYPGAGRTFQTTLEHKAHVEAAQRNQQKAAEARRTAQEAQESQEAREEPLPGQTVLEGVTEAQEAIAS